MRDSSAPSPVITGLTWTRLVGITLMVMVIGVILGAVITTQFGLFAPPLLPFTVPIYLLLWLPVFLGGLLMRPHGSWKPLVALVVLGAIIGIAGLVAMGAAVGHSVNPCHHAPLPDQPMRYECGYVNYQNAPISFVLVGSTGSIFVQVAEPTN
jgi:hypothetical protein